MKAFPFAIGFLFSVSGMSQAVIPLYQSGKIPNSKASAEVVEKSETRDGILIISGVTDPSMTVFLPKKDKANGTAVVIYPGGGYSIVAAGHEGNDIAKALNEIGITAFVVKYRLPDARIMNTPEIGPLQDAQRALQLVRQRAGDWHLNPAKVGIIGFSAGGHLASTVGTKFDAPVIENGTQTNLRPDFMILIYPVISADSAFGHMGSFERLLGPGASREKRLKFSSEKQITARTPPTFLVHASDDDVVPPKNSIVFYEMLLKKKVPAELHIYEKGGHGFGLRNPTTSDLWVDRLKNWLKSNDFL